MHSSCQEGTACWQVLIPSQAGWQVVHCGTWRKAFFKGPSSAAVAVQYERKDTQQTWQFHVASPPKMIQPDDQWMVLTRGVWTYSASQKQGQGQSLTLSTAAWLCWSPSTMASHWTLQKEEPKQFSSWASQHLAGTGIPLLPTSWLMHTVQHVCAHSVYKSCPSQLLSHRVSLISSNTVFPAFPPLPHRATVAECTVPLLGWLHTRQERLGHLARCSQEGEGAAEQAPSTYSNPQAPAHTEAELQQHPGHQWHYQGKSHEDQSRAWIANRSNDPPAATCLLRSQFKKERECLEKQKCTSPESLPSLLPVYTAQISCVQTSWTMEICDESY